MKKRVTSKIITKSFRYLNSYISKNLEKLVSFNMGFWCCINWYLNTFLTIVAPIFVIDYFRWLLTIVVVLFLLSLMAIYLMSDTYPKVQVFEEEKTFEDDKGNKEKFPSLDDNASLDLSVIVPAYNEEDRLPKMLEECTTYLEENLKDKFEIIIVDDGSKDDTSKIVLEWSRKLG